MSEQLVCKITSMANGSPLQQGNSGCTGPGTAEILAKVPVSSAAELDEAVQSAQKAFQDWRKVPVTKRIQYLFNLKTLLEANFEDLARCITLEHGKVMDESRGEMRRAIENVEVACGTPILMMGDVVEDVAPALMSS